MQLRFHPSEIKSLSDRYVSSLSKEEYDEEFAIINLKKKIQKAFFMTKEELYLVGKWKTKRVSKRLLENKEKLLKMVCITILRKKRKMKNLMYF